MSAPSNVAAAKPPLSSTTQKEQNKEVIKQIHSLHNDHRQPGKRRGQRKRFADRFE
jgi:hypothetical protein